MNENFNCEICGCIKDSQVSNIGGDEYFSDEVEKAMKKLQVLGEQRNYGSLDSVLRCPFCGLIYFYIEERSFTGSGGSDNKYLYRAHFKPDDEIGRQGLGYYNEMIGILSESKKKSDPEVKEIIRKCQSTMPDYFKYV